MRPPSERTVGIVVGATILLTAFHFTDNIVNVDTYPRQDWISGSTIQISGLIFWPLFSAFGVTGYLLYRRGRFPLAHVYLIAFSYLGLVSLLHFTAASPAELTTRGLVSVMIDGVCGLTVLGVTVWSIIARRAGPACASPRPAPAAPD
jgi:hypothetical protein